MGAGRAIIYENFIMVHDPLVYNGPVHDLTARICRPQMREKELFKTCYPETVTAWGLCDDSEDSDPIRASFLTTSQSEGKNQRLKRRFVRSEQIGRQEVARPI